ncbi:MAG: rhodanese-like domain-containing protein [Gemmatimonadetes bacterium]|nr:rhodanese-like domain-containing protein [Gemmatimonadota bacterium]MYA21579.1 rhodanese-like domain-containing protein [Gemmatimonadota bacterium]MYB67363.1 rhodanese-like domain-containing protein [Gemmatimonadota bacterium]
MKRIVGKALLVVVLGVFSGALHSLAVDDVQGPEKGVQVIDLAMAKRLFDQKAAVFVDARSSWPYQLGHVPGALNVPPSGIPAAFDAELADLPKDTVLVVYCSGATCNLGRKLAQKLAEEMGFTRIYVFEGGFPQWEEAGYPVESEGPF